MVVLHYCELCQQKCGWQKRGLEGTQTSLMSWGSPCLCRRLDIWDPGGGRKPVRKYPFDAGPACARALSMSKRNTPLTMVRRHWPVEGLQTRNPVGGAQGGMEIHLWSTHTHISSKGKSKTAKTHFLTSICIGPSRSQSFQNSIFFYMKRPNEHQC